MTRRALVHIGLAKTGTTAIQTTMAANRTVLSAAGVLYPHAGTINGLGGHHCLAWALGANPRLGALCHGDPFGPLEREIEGAREATLLLSSEEFSGISYNGRAITRLMSSLRSAETTVVVYVREQVEWFNSFYAETLKELTETRAIGEVLSSLRLEPRYHYEEWLSLWRKASTTLLVRPFIRNRLVNKDVVQDFLHATGLSGISVAQPRMPSANPTLSAPRVTALLYIARLLQERGVAPERIPRAAWQKSKKELLREVLDDRRLDGETYWGIGKELTRDIRQQYRASNRAFLRANSLDEDLFEHPEEKSLQTVRLSQLDSSIVNYLSAKVAAIAQAAKPHRPG